MMPSRYCRHGVILYGTHCVRCGPDAGAEPPESLVRQPRRPPEPDELHGFRGPLSRFSARYDTGGPIRCAAHDRENCAPCLAAAETFIQWRPVGDSRLRPTHAVRGGPIMRERDGLASAFRAESSAMTLEDVIALRPGDQVRHVSGTESFLVTGNYGARVTAVRTVDITNPSEWTLVRKAGQ